MAARSIRWRVWLMGGAAAVALVVGVVLGHGLLIAAGLALAGTSGLGAPADRREYMVPPTEDGCWHRWSPPPDPRRLGGDRSRARREEGAPAMDLTHTTVPGTGRLTHLVTRGGQRLGVLTTDDTRQLLVYEPEVDPDVPVRTIDLDADEADEVAAMLHSPSIVDRLDVLERTVAAVTRERR